MKIGRGQESECGPSVWGGNSGSPCFIRKSDVAASAEILRKIKNTAVARQKRCFNIPAPRPLAQSQAHQPRESPRIFFVRGLNCASRTVASILLQERVCDFVTRDRKTLREQSHFIQDNDEKLVLGACFGVAGGKTPPFSMDSFIRSTHPQTPEDKKERLV